MTLIAQLNAEVSINRMLLLLRSYSNCVSSGHLSSNNVKLVLPRDSLSPLPSPAKRPRLEDACRTDNMAREDITNTQEPLHLHQVTAEQIAPQVTDNFTWLDIAWGGPKCSNLPLVFPHYICTSIVKRDDEASITVSYPSDPALCELSLAVSATEVQHIAKELFDVHIREIDGRRSIVFDNGTIMMIDSSATLSGAALPSLDKLFGPMVSVAVQRSSRRMREYSQGLSRLSCISMKIWAAAGDPASLSFATDAAELANIQEKLWQYP